MYFGPNIECIKSVVVVRPEGYVPVLLRREYHTDGTAARAKILAERGHPVRHRQVAHVGKVSANPQGRSFDIRPDRVGTQELLSAPRERSGV